MKRARGALGAAALAFVCSATVSEARALRHATVSPHRLVRSKAAVVAATHADGRPVGMKTAAKGAPPLPMPAGDDLTAVLAALESATPVVDDPEPRAFVGHIKGRAAVLRSTMVKKVRPVRPVPPNATWLAYRRPPWRRGYATLSGHGKKWSGYLVGPDGEVLPEARQALSSTLSSWRTGKQVMIDDRLIQLIADVSDEFGGRPIRIVSGYRETSYAPDSKHKVGQAFDFSIPGVPNEMLRDFLRSLPDVGVGYYPNSTHVHLDVRDKPTYWVDYSRPGQAPMYSYDRRIAVLSAAERAERALAAALEEILHRTLEQGHETDSPPASGPDTRSPRSRGKQADDDSEDEAEPTDGSSKSADVARGDAGARPQNAPQPAVPLSVR